jgi:proline iminopeptidase
MSAYELWPEIKPFDEAYLPVSEIHTIRYALYGNPNGIPVFFLHGGPGGGSDHEDARWFDPEKYLIVIHDQRGSGKSTPLAEIIDNTSRDLVNDIERLRNHLNIHVPISVFGGSWGSTLALLYAEAFPQNVSRLILRGIFTCTWDAQDYFYSSNGSGLFSPEAWDRFIKKIPEGPGRIQEKIHGLIEESNMKGKEKWCRILAEYEYSFFNLPEEEFANTISDFESYFPEMRLNIYYQANRFFLEDKQILRDAYRIKDIPITLINGSRDIICPPVLAWELHKCLSRSELIFVENGGHLSSDPNIKQALLSALKNWD